MRKLVLGKGRVKLYHGKCLEVLRSLPDEVIDSIVTDPPYGINFMNKHWDYSVPPARVWAECLRVLKPGGYLLAFAGTRTQHRMAVNIEDGGFNLQDVIMWLYGSGFPKSMDIGKSIDKALGKEREVVGVRKHPTLKDPTKIVRSGANPHHGSNVVKDEWPITAPASEQARQWQGWGTQLKPAYEPIILAKKNPDSSITYNVMVHGVGALNIDACRVPIAESDLAEYEFNMNGGNRSMAEEGDELGAYEGGWKVRKGEVDLPSGRFPANVIHDGSDDVEELFAKEGESTSTGGWAMQVGMQNLRGDTKKRIEGVSPGKGDTGTPARFFYCAKASQGDRTEYGEVDNEHPTVKPTELMAYLARLITPPDGWVLDLFMGSGSTGKAAVQEGFKFVGIERDEDSFETATQRISLAVEKHRFKPKSMFRSKT